MLKAYEYRLYPSKSQKEILAKTFGSCRFVYNQALKYCIDLYNTEHKSISYVSLANEFLIKLKAELPWLKEVPSQTLQQSLRHLGVAYNNFFNHSCKFPRFKTKYDKQSCSFPQGVKVNFDKNEIFIPILKETSAVLHRKFEGTVKTCTVTKRTTGKYYISVLVEDGKSNPEFVFGPNVIGIDLGVTNYAVFSNEDKIENPRVLDKHLRRIKRLQQQLSIKTKGSNNYNKVKLQLAKEHEKIKNIRSDFLHKESRKIINKNHVIIMEKLDVQNMLEKSNHGLARSITDCAWSTFISYIKYKANFYGKKFIQIGKYKPSSKTCSACGLINKDLKLSDREWVCSCGAKHDRDINAAINILNFGMEQPEYKALKTGARRSKGNSSTKKSSSLIY